MRTVPHLFMPSQTIHGVIKKYNMHAVSDLELQVLMITFNELNSRQVPKPGQRFAIPILQRLEHLYNEDGSRRTEIAALGGR